MREQQKLTYLDSATRLTEPGFLWLHGNPLSTEIVL